MINNFITLLVRFYKCDNKILNVKNFVCERVEFLTFSIMFNTKTDK